MDRARLEYEMKKCGVSVEELCAAVGFSKSAYYRKCKGISDFTVTEIQKIVSYLNLGTPIGIFFAENVS